MRFFLKIAFKGTAYHGWQNQPNANSIQSVLEQALKILLKSKTQVVGCGRTDSGVHAKMFYLHFDTDEINDINGFAYKLNAILPKDIVVYQLYTVTNNAHARFDALLRTYEYHILLENNPFELDTAWQLPNKKISIEKMNEAAQLLLLHSDFQSFSKKGSDVKNFLCNVSEAYWTQTDKKMSFNITSNRFLRNMVRAIVGTLLEVGEGKITITDFENIIQSKNRSEAGLSVPAHGLFLSNIVYPSEIFASNRLLFE